MRSARPPQRRFSELDSETRGVTRDVPRLADALRLATVAAHKCLGRPRAGTGKSVCIRLVLSWCHFAFRIDRLVRAGRRRATVGLRKLHSRVGIDLPRVNTVRSGFQPFCWFPDESEHRRRGGFTPGAATFNFPSSTSIHTPVSGGMTECGEIPAQQ